MSGTALAIDKSINFFKKCFLILPLSLDRVELYLQTKTVIEKRWLRVQIVFLQYFKDAIPLSLASIIFNDKSAVSFIVGLLR